MATATTEIRLAPANAPLINRSVAITGALTLAAIGVAVVGHGMQAWVVMAAALGALGGVVHEFAQSGGKVLAFERHDDGLYLGTAAGLILGAVAGALAVQGTVVLAAAATVDINPVAVAYTAFLAGLALKGVTEAAAGQRPDAPDTPDVRELVEDLRRRIDELRT